MITVGLLLGADKESTVKQMNEIFEFEKNLAIIYESKDKVRETDQIYHKMTVAELQSLCPAVGTFLFICIENVTNFPRVRK